MATPLTPRPLLMQAVDAYLKFGATRGAKELGITRNSILARIRAASSVGLITQEQINAASESRMLLSGTAATDTSDPRDIKLAALERDNKIMRARLTELSKAMDDGLRLRELVFGLTGAPEPIEWALGTPDTSETHSCPILFFSDPQWGEVVKAREMDGVSFYDIPTARARYRMMIDKTIGIARDHMGEHMRYPGIYYLRGGDMVSGNIHAELRETNQLLAIPATQDLFNEEVEGIKKLANFFGRVHVCTVAGNHGRDTFKPQAKGFADSNYDTLGAWMLETHFKHLEGYSDRVTFETATSPDIQFDIYTTRFLLTHGDRIGSRGGQGFIGSIATIVRGQKRIIEEYTAYGVNIDHVLTGHFHEPCESIYGWGNGCLPGYSEYAKSGRMGRPSRPSQWLLFVHPKHGVTSRWQLYLGSRPALNWKHNTGPLSDNA